MSTEEATLQELWDSIAPSVPGEPVGSVQRMADGWYICWNIPGCGFVDMEPIGDEFEQASMSLHALAWGGEKWNVTMADIMRAESILAQLPSMFEMDW